MTTIDTTVNVSSRGFLLAAAVGTGLGVALFVTNAVYYGRARNNCNSISRNTANVMMWLNIILAIIFVLLFIWIIYRLLVHPELRRELTQRATTYLTTAPQGPIGAPQVVVTQPGAIPTATSGTLASNVVTPDTAAAIKQAALAAQ